MSKNNIVVSLIIMILTGCMNISTPTSVPASQTPLIANTVIPTPTLLPLASPTAAPDPRYVQKCVKIEDQVVSLKDVTSGTILLFTNPPENQPFLLDIQTGRKYLLPTEVKNPTFLGEYVSPDGNKFAYVEGVVNSEYKFDKAILWVTNAHAEVLAKLRFNQGLGNNLRWLDNDHVIFYFDQTGVDGTVMVVNPFTGEQQLIFNKLPNLVTGDLAWDVNWRAEYSKDLNWVAYLGSSNPAGGSPIVYDVKTKKIIWQAVTDQNWDMSVWSPDDSQVTAIVWDDQTTQSELYLIDHSGHAKPIFVMGRKQAFAPSWSPDGNRIAFWNNHELMVYDLKADKTTSLCIGNEADRQYPPVWSPDSSQLGVDQYMDEQHTVLINIQQGVGYIPTEIQGIATYPNIWMNSIP
ncbi:MAG: hypothetical protein ABI904_05590 [Chloroflexota bacterium]